ncbi:MAG: hypothetical protein K8T25_19055 [Planctomycetia bacterium]|nr:hypothetical protein [Planctomycetia bacterium]
MSKAKYKLAIQVVGDVVHDWDPYTLLAAGCPVDEFDSEIASIVAQIPRINSEEDATLALSRVFSSAFEPSRFTPELCSMAGIKLFEALSANGLLD